MTYKIVDVWRPHKDTIHIQHFDDRAAYGTMTTVVLWRDGDDVRVTAHVGQHRREWPNSGPMPEGPGYTEFRTPSFTRLRRYIDEAVAASGEAVSVVGYPEYRTGRHWSWTFRTVKE